MRFRTPSGVCLSGTGSRCWQPNVMASLTPASSLFTPLEGLRFLAFATYRNTLKYKSILEDQRVAILIEDREGDATRRSDQRLVLTAVGEAIKTPVEDRQAYIMTHLARHPNLEEFLISPDCEFVLCWHPRLSGCEWH